MKFAHLSDLHIGGWRDPRMRELSMQVFLAAMERCIAEGVDFILFAGDLFNTALPEVDKLDRAAKKLKELKDRGIPVYVIPGSHDFSPSGKTMIDVFESAGLFTNVCKGGVVGQKLRLRFTVDRKTGAKLTGMLGKKGMLDRFYYEDLDRESLEQEPGYKIFLFHTSISELKPAHLAQMDSYALSLLPRGFRYYAGGHIHHRVEYHQPGYAAVTYPGALFPNSFSELERYGHGGFYLVEDDRLEWIPVKLKERIAITLSCDDRTPGEVQELLAAELKQQDIHDAIVTLRLEGTLRSGKASDINANEVMAQCDGAFAVLRNMAALHSREFEEIKLEQKPIEELEDALIREHTQQIRVEGMDAAAESALAKELMLALAIEKNDGETVRDFEERVKKGAVKVLEIV